MHAGIVLVSPQMGECTSSTISPSLAIKSKNLCTSICLGTCCDEHGTPSIASAAAVAVFLICLWHVCKQVASKGVMYGVFYGFLVF